MIGPKTKTNYIMTVMIRPGPGPASTELNQCSEQDTVMYEGYSSSMLTSILLFANQTYDVWMTNMQERQKQLKQEVSHFHVKTEDKLSPPRDSLEL